MAEIKFWRCKVCAHEQPVSSGSVCSGCGNDLLLYGYIVMNGAQEEPPAPAAEETPPIQTQTPTSTTTQTQTQTSTQTQTQTQTQTSTQTQISTTATTPKKSRKGVIAAVIIAAVLAAAAVAGAIFVVAMARRGGAGTRRPGYETQQNSTPGGGAPPSETQPEKQPERPQEGADEETEPEEYGRNEFPYVNKNGTTPLSISTGSFIGAPTADSVLFDVGTENIIHDGKGSYFCFMYSTAAAAFDLDTSTFYDCDEACAFENEGDADFGIVPDNWNRATRDEALADDLTGYVGAYFRDGIRLTQVRLLPRVNWTTRIYRCYIEASKDGVNWTKIGTVLDEYAIPMEFLAIDVPPGLEDTVYKYVRLVGAPHISDNTDDWSFCNVAELEIWGRLP